MPKENLSVSTKETNLQTNFIWPYKDAKREGFFDHVIVNEDFDRAYEDLKRILKEDIDARHSYLKYTNKSLI